MKLSENARLEIKLHWFWLRCIFPTAFVIGLGFCLPTFDEWPLMAKVVLGAVVPVAHYAWFRQCLSPDKKTFRPRIWK